MEKIISDDVLYAVKYKVHKLKENFYLLYPIDTVVGHEEENEFVTDDGVLPFAANKEALDNNEYVSDFISSLEELRRLYDYYDSDEFLLDFFEEDSKDTMVLTTVEKDGELFKVDLEYDMLVSADCDAVYCMEKSYPAAILNEASIQEILKCQTKEELEKLLRIYRKRMLSFQDINKKEKVARVYVSNNRVERIDIARNIDTKVVEKVEKGMETKTPTRRKRITYNSLRKYIKERIYGHDDAIDTIAQNLYMNYTAANNEKRRSMLLIGPTGVGKSRTFELAGEYLKLPYVEANAANLVTQGIVGTSIEDLLISLYEQAGQNLELAQRGIVFLDEFDKLNDIKLDTKASVRHILLTFMAGAKFYVNTQGYDFVFDTGYLNKVYAGVYQRITGAQKSIGFTSLLGSTNVSYDSKSLEQQLIAADYHTREEISRVQKKIFYADLDTPTKIAILKNGKDSIFLEEATRIKRQFRLNLIAQDDYFETLMDPNRELQEGMRTVNNAVLDTFDCVEKSLLEGVARGHKSLILTRETAINPNHFILK